MILVSFYARCIDKINIFHNFVCYIKLFIKLHFINKEFYSRIFKNTGIITALYIQLIDVNQT